MQTVKKFLFLARIILTCRTVLSSYCMTYQGMTNPPQKLVMSCSGKVHIWWWSIDLYPFHVELLTTRFCFFYEKYQDRSRSMYFFSKKSFTRGNFAFLEITKEGSLFYRKILFIENKYVVTLSRKEGAMPIDMHERNVIHSAANK